MGRLVLVSNRVPAARGRAQLAGGLAVALRDSIAGRETLWFGWSGGHAAAPAAGTPPVKQTTIDALTLATIDLSEHAYRGFYLGFSNGLLWPLLHGRMGLAEFSRDQLETYFAVNDAYARALVPLLRPDDVIWVHDYHLIPLGAALRRAGVQARIGFFLHIPFPPRQVFAMLPQAERLLTTFDAYDVIGMQTKADAANLADTLRGAKLPGRPAAYPIGIDPDSFAQQAQRAIRSAEYKRLDENLGRRTLILGVDRLDYTKGIPERFLGFARLIKRFPEHRKNVIFLQVAPVSRGDVSHYDELRRTLDELVGRINGEHAEFDWMPLRYITRSVPRATLAGFHRRARVGLVTPLRDGMNLVAKEYVAAQDPAHPGALVLSQFAGAAEAMQGALLVNPHDPDEIAEALHAGLTMEEGERQERWRTLDEAVRASTAAIWAKSFLDALEQRSA